MLCLIFLFLTINFLNKMLYKSKNRIKPVFSRSTAMGLQKGPVTVIKETSSNFIPVFDRKLEKKKNVKG